MRPKIVRDIRNGPQFSNLMNMGINIMCQRTIWGLNFIAPLSWLFLVVNFVCCVMQKVEGLMRLMEGEHVGPFNLGNPGEFTMLELAKVSFYGYICIHFLIITYDPGFWYSVLVGFCSKVVQETIDPNANIEFRPNTEDDPHKRKPDITKAKELLGWEPKVSLRQGLPLMVKDFRQRVFGDQKEGSSTAATTTTKKTSAWADAESRSGHCSWKWIYNKNARLCKATTWREESFVSLNLFRFWFLFW